MSPEQYLEQLAEEKDLTQLMQYCQLVNAKYMQMQSQQYFEQVSKGGAAAANATPPMGFPMAAPGMAPNMMGQPN